MKQQSASLLGLAVVGALIVLVPPGARVHAQLPPPRPPSTSVCPSITPSPQIAVRATGAVYRPAPPGHGGTFRTGQAADVVLSSFGFNDSGGPLMFNHPTGIATDGTRLLLADRFNNRVLLWAVLPGSGADAPTIALGQPDLRANNPGTGRDQMNWPGAVSISLDGKVVVADSYNNRLLIWNQIPTRSGQPADVVVRHPDLWWPWGVWTDGRRLAATSTSVPHRVLFWTSFPVADDAPPSYQSTGGGQLGTPRTITTDGARFFAVGDHGSRGPLPGVATHVWRSYPTGDRAPDFAMRDPLDWRYAWLSGAFTTRGDLVMLGRFLHIWDGIPTSGDVPPRLTLDDFPFEGGDGAAVAAAGDRLFVSMYNGNRVVVYRTVPDLERDPDFAVGSPDICTNTLATYYRMTNAAPATNGRSLFASSGFDRTLYVWRDIPDESGAAPDYVYALPLAARVSVVHGDTLVLAGYEGSNTQTVLLWTKLPLHGELPDVTYQHGIGSARFTSLSGVALDGRYFSLADESGTVWIWEGIPTPNQEPIATLEVQDAKTLHSDGTYLVVTRTNASAIVVYRLRDVSDGMQPYLVLQNSVSGRYSFNLPEHAITVDNHLFVADTCHNRILVWTNLDAARNQLPDLILGADTLTDVSPEIGQTKLFWPGQLAYDGTHLWVGENKFSNRLVRFSRQASSLASQSRVSR